MCAVAANDDADEVIDEDDIACRWWPDALDIAMDVVVDITGCECGWWGSGCLGNARMRGQTRLDDRPERFPVEG